MEADGVLAYLDRGEQATVRLSSCYSEADIESLAIWQWMAARNEADDKLKNKILNGSLPIVTPYREIALVHAVQVHVISPRWLPLSLGQRFQGNTAVSIFGSFSVHGKSSAKVDVLSEWSEWVDDPHLAAPFRRGGNGTVPFPAHPVAIAHIGEVKVDTGDNLVLIGPFTSSIAPGQIEVSPLAQEFGDTKHRWVSYRLRGATRFQEYFPQGTSPLSLDGTPDQLNVLSTARPSAPLVKYVVPAYSWAETQHQHIGASGAANWTVNTRSGNLARVYLDRPWYSSGDGEQLAVVYAGKNDGSVALQEVITGGSGMPPQTLVTVWGADPLYKTVSSGPPDGSNASLFKGAAAVLKGLTLEELQNTDITVCAAAYPVSYDGERKLWYADLKIDLGSMQFPFIRLALARYQKNSLAGCELSRVVLADFVQLAPDRVATVLRTKPAEMPRNPANCFDVPGSQPPATLKLYSLSVC